MDHPQRNPSRDGSAPARIDWNEAWRVARELTGRRAAKESWDQRAPSFAQNASKSGYVERMLELMAPAPGCTVLDVGCGPGTLAIPLARKASSVTALDFSPRMLELLRGRCAEEGIANVVPVLGSWEDDWAALGVAPCDVALASRSLSVVDLRAALLKLDRFARRRVFLTAPVGEGPIDSRVLRAAGRGYVPGPDYLYPYNLLQQLGIEASVAFIPVEDTRRYADLDDALERLSWMLPDPTASETEKLRAWLKRELVQDGPGFRLASPRTVKWAVLSWSKDGRPRSEG